MLTAARKRIVDRAVGRRVGKISLRARTRRGLVAALVPATAALALPAVAPVAVTIFGSDLSISKNRRRLGATMRVAVGGQTFATPVTLKI